MLKTELLRTLTLSSGGQAGHALWVSAASGLVHAHGQLYVVADDEHHLCHFAFDAAKPHADDPPLQRLRLLPGTLPVDDRARKKAKPDLESLLLLPATAQAPLGTLLCLGSGGKTNRRRALTLPLRTGGAVSARDVVSHDLADFFDALERHVDDLNIEGAFLNGTSLCLLQRGNKGSKAQSACLGFDAAHFIDWLSGSHRHLPMLQTCTTLDFGRIDGVPLCPTDATPLPGGGWVATLVAEDTDNSVNDGRCVASAIAVMDAGHRLDALHRLQGNPKVEGVALAGTGGQHQPLTLLLVTDADDPMQPSQLLQLRVPGQA